MRRLRIVFALSALALLVPMGLLVHRALGSVALERRMRHAAVAERVLDEMERALSEALTREEERPFGHYGYYFAPPEQVGGRVAVTRSPLADLPALPFVVGHFQIDPDGRLDTPLRPPDAARAQAAGEWAPSPRVLAAIGEIERVVGGQWRTAAAPARRGNELAKQLPGTTLGLEAATPAAQREDEARPDAAASAYDALRTLNKGVEQRAERKAKLSAEYALEEGLSSGPTPAPSQPANLAMEPSAVAEAVRLELPPMVGRVLSDRHMLLWRTVVVDGRAYRQGLLLDLPRLWAWLGDRAIGTELAPQATVSFATPFAPPPARVTAEFAWVHRFAEPFDELAAVLTLRPLPGLGGAAYVRALAAALLLAGVLGLLALYRLSSVAVAFAERRSNFVAAVSHELKTPLTAIRMYAEMLRDGIVPSEAKRDEYYGYISVESERLGRLINNVLEFSRLEKGTRQMTLVVASPAAVVREAAELVRPHVEREGFALAVEVDGAVGTVHLERDALLQVLFNLVDNAVKYAREALPRRITIGCRQQGERVRVTVRDHGPGVAARHLARIFEPFYRGESESTRRSKGTGLGLALVRGLAEAMGARVGARNHPDGGFEVELAFPARPAGAMPGA